MLLSSAGALMLTTLTAHWLTHPDPAQHSSLFLHWVVGTGPDDKQPLRIYHFDGIQWNNVPGPVLHGEAIESLGGVRSDLWAVGQYANLGQKAFDGLNKTFMMSAYFS